MDDTRSLILSRRARFMALAISVCSTACDGHQACLSMPPDCDGGPDAPSDGLHVTGPKSICSGARAALTTRYFGRCGYSSEVSPKQLRYQSGDPGILRIEGTDAIGVAPGHAVVAVEFTDGSGTGSGEIDVVACEDAGGDAMDDASVDSAEDAPSD
jgi:hypothetical protein